MNENWALNASPIILLGKAGLLKTVSPLAKVWIIPESVIREVEAKRPGNGISPMRWDEMIKMKASRDFNADEIVCL